MAIVLFSFMITILIAPLIHPTIAGPRAELLAKICGDVKVQDITKYTKNYAKILETMDEEMQKNKFAMREEGVNPNKIYVLSQCIDDLSRDDCGACFSKISSRLAGCFPYTDGRVYLDGCFMRFNNYSFFRETSSRSFDLQNCSEGRHAAKEYTESATVLINDLVGRAPHNKGYYADGKIRSSDDLSVYGAAGCWRSLDAHLCAECLADAAAGAANCLPEVDGLALNPGCFLRFSNLPFANNHKTFDNRDVILRRLSYAFVIGFSLLVLFLIGIFVAKIFSEKRRKRQSETEGTKLDTLVTISLRFKYATLQKATADFSESNKIGKGGYGEVFKGALPDGREIAVKRLFLSGQNQVHAVCNEMDIICLAQHKNLVRFLGCCFANNDSFLVYEFLANGSLDRILFDPQKQKELDWKRRLGIIEGTAEGLEYLHKDCQVRIVHRDIKSSNILLDWRYKPKISDFGLARFYSNDQIVSNTAIAGTLCYMAPEYLAHGRLTEKVDVYSYGVLVLEMVSGIRNNKYHSEDNLSTLVTTAWKHFQGETVGEIIDRSMQIEDMNEVMRIVRIGLLCTQESPSLRPTMTDVVQMLRDKNLELPSPSKPPFVDEFLPMPDPSVDSCSLRGHRHSLSTDSCKYYDVDSDQR